MSTHRRISADKSFWKGVDPALAAARARPGWGEFHRRASLAGLSFETVAVTATADGFATSAFRIERKYGHAMRHLVARGAGDSPEAALADALRQAIAAGFVIDQALADLLRPDPVEVAAGDLEDLFGIVGPPAAACLEGLIG